MLEDTFLVVCDGLTGLPEVVGNVWPQASAQTCIIDVKPIYTAVKARGNFPSKQAALKCLYLVTRSPDP